MSKKILIFVILSALFLSNTLAQSNNVRDETGNISHSVLVELGSLTTCPYCPEAINTLNNLLDSQELPFYYITLVYDKSEVAQKRGMWLGDVYVPVAYVDGGYRIVQESSEREFRDAIEAAMEREVNDIKMEVDGKWSGNDIMIYLNITNDDEKRHLEHLKVCIIEINSRWQDYDGDQIHYALMDYAFNGYIILKSGATKKIEIKWNNKYDLKEGNAMILACAADWHPWLLKNPWNDPLWSAYFISQFVDNVAAIAL